MTSITIRNLSSEAEEFLRTYATKKGITLEEAATRHLLNNLTKPFEPLYRANANNMQSLQSTSILLIIGGGIAAYKALDLIRRLQERGAYLNVIVTQAAQKFITPLVVEALTNGTVYSDLFSCEKELDISHIRLARNADLIILAPATANRIAKIATGIADDLANCVLLATRCPLLIAPAMNPTMWTHPATVRNITQLREDGVHIIGPENGEMAEKNEAGYGRMSEPLTIVAFAETLLEKCNKSLSGRHFIVTSGPTREQIDPIRYLTNRSSGKQGHAIATALAALGAEVTLVCGPVNLPNPPGVKTIHVETALQMFHAVQAALPADGAIFAAAVCDWRCKTHSLKKIKNRTMLYHHLYKWWKILTFLATIGYASNRPPLVIGFAAETCDIIVNAQKKCVQKNADFILANDISLRADGTTVMDSDSNTIYLISKETVDKWPLMTKKQVAQKLANIIVSFFSSSSDNRDE
ncbi:bifunctional phosphopantothenoylcysteine decarboxylase/phosphopantothenate--cysteine ligase CoaBC [Bartonella ancashensis]|uniref:Coenzyme A biosynthesis bifunctional protein CoaBC n=1 Tax=Bartonella ancashensis TaxID=1318743 RepID=A0A0M3T2R4_9HYPH|nr:bifunctional phosphopantothenoylcysteine decarboxylase/phosphopantothenate--cysteine ligase CoaBC [Bartonella ancashensis]ALE03301.1 Phosphopantothenoylcysteine decarboxylase [Bartonella ancashensis]